MYVMNETAAIIHSTADDYAAAASRRTRQFAVMTILLASAIGVVFATAENENPMLPLALILLILIPTFWHFPRLPLYIGLAAVCLIEIFPTSYSDALTDRIPFFWNVNTILQVYGHMDFKAIPLNLFEIFMIIAGFCSVLKAVFTKTISLRVGPLFRPIAIYIAFVALGWANGILTGGDFKISLMEVRSQFYFFLAYLMVVNLVRERRQIGIFLWTAALCIGFKGILYTFRRYVTLAGTPLPDQGVGSHEEAFLFDTFAFLLIVLSLCGIQKRLRLVMWTLLPLVLLGNLACNRRAATAALVVVLPILFLAAYRVLPQRRKIVGIVGILLVVGLSVYYPIFRNSDSAIAQPARAIKSQFQPDARDAASNAYRDAENMDLMATIKSAPIQGYGYGKRMFHVAPIVDISKDYEWWDVMTHNQILWVWMRVGSIGFFAFWMMVGAILIFACLAIKQENVDIETKAVGLFTMLILAALMIFGLLDLQLSNYRDMMFTGFWIGLLAIMPSLPPAIAVQTRTVLKRAVNP